MKCHEFIEAAESLTPSQLSLMRVDDAAISEHARECATCGRWLESQTLLGNAMQTLRASTAQREASPKVEQTVLRAFRVQEFAPAVSSTPERAAPVMWRLSRYFEMGAYAAVAAALILAVFLGSRLLRERQVSSPSAQTQSVHEPQPGNAAVVTSGATDKVAENVTSKTAAIAAKRKTRVPRVAEQRPATTTTAVAAAPDSGEYVALMLCDPLICSGDEQVIRMELPGTAAEGSASQPVLADVVIGDDGLVRAMRIVR